MAYKKIGFINQIDILTGIGAIFFAVQFPHFGKISCLTEEEPLITGIGERDSSHSKRIQGYEQSATDLAKNTPGGCEL